MLKPLEAVKPQQKKSFDNIFKPLAWTQPLYYADLGDIQQNIFLFNH